MSGEYATQASAVDHIAPAPAVDAALAPVGECIAPALAWYAAPAPVVKYMALAPTVGAATVSAVEDSATSLKV